MPREALIRLEQLADRLSRQFGGDPRLFGEIGPFRSAVGRLFHEPGAVEDLLVHGNRLLARLVPRSS